MRKLEIALVMCRNRHDGTRAVFHQDEIGRPYGHFFAGDRMNGVDAQRHAFFLQSGHVGFGDFGVAAFLNKSGQFGIVFSGFFRQRVLGGHADKAHAHQGVGAGGVHGQRFCAFDAEL